jgi:hypothetical protein
MIHIAQDLQVCSIKKRKQINDHASKRKKKKSKLIVECMAVILEISTLGDHFIITAMHF